MDDTRYIEAKRHFNKIQALAPEARTVYLDALAPELRADVQGFLDDGLS